MPLIQEERRQKEEAKRLAEKERLEKEEAIKLASEAQARMKASILRLHAKGNTPEEIADMLGFALDEVNKIIKNH